MIGVVDYGLGNVQAFLNVFKRLNVPAIPARTAADVLAVDKLVLPGVGAFDHAMELLQASGMREALDRRVRDDGVPVLGVCVGMQILAAGSDEGGRSGLDWIPGRVRSLSGLGGADMMLPHMGWNDVSPTAEAPLFRSMETDARFYFLHSYYFDCTVAAHASATCTYGRAFACAVSAGNVHGVQFHPEKSHHFGVQLLRNFAEL